MTAPVAPPREYAVRAETTRTFGRVLVGAREQHLVVDGPVQNGCPGEAITPAELFLAGVAACGAELIEVIARDEGVPLDGVSVTMTGLVDRGRQSRPDVTTFTRVHMDIVLTGADDARAAALVEGFKRR
jgi:uncharacterized OsmC-like protein